MSRRLNQEAAKAVKYGGVSEVDASDIPLLAILDVLAVQVSLFHSRNLKPLGRNFSEYTVLTTLLLSPAGLTPRQLADATRRPTAAVAQILNRLESDGLLRREANPEDRRSTLVQLTVQGRELARDLCAREAASADRIFAGLDEGEKEELRSAVNKLILTFGEQS